jgi:peptidyl-prolyl cis-trans isomerase SurA
MASKRLSVFSILIFVLALGLANTDISFSHAEDKTPVKATAAEKPRDLLDGIVAVVGNDVITRSELAEALAYPAALLRARQQAGMPKEEAEKEFAKLQQETRKNLVNNKLILLAAQTEGMTVDDEVRQRMDKLRAGFKNEPEKMSQVLAQQGFSSVDEYRVRMRDELLRQRMIFGRIRPRAELEKDELTVAFTERYAGKKAVEAGCQGALIQYHTMQQIWYSMPEEELSFRGLIDVYGAAYGCLLRFRTGELEPAAAAATCAWGDLAPTHGELGEVDETKSFDPAFQKAFDELRGQPAGSYSEPFVIKDGIRILRLVSSRAGCVEDADELTRLKDRVKVRLEDEKFEKVMHWWLQELQGQFRVDLKKL